MKFNFKKSIKECVFTTILFQDDKTFEIYHATFANPKFQDYHRRLQTFIIWYIDAASYIDDEDHSWNLYTLFEKVTSCGETRLVLEYDTNFRNSHERLTSTYVSLFAEDYPLF